MELHCPRELALKLGAIAPISVQEHRQLRGEHCMLVRAEAGQALFWPLQLVAASS